VTLTVTPVSTTTDIKINDPLPYPNPCNPDTSGITIRYNLTRNATEIKFKLYTANARLIREHKESGGISAGIKTMQIESAVFEKLSQGIYFYVIEGKADNGTTARSVIDKIVIIR
jgi:hypothetical protein